MDIEAMEKRASAREGELAKIAVGALYRVFVGLGIILVEREP